MYIITASSCGGKIIRVTWQAANNKKNTKQPLPGSRSFSHRQQSKLFVSLSLSFFDDDFAHTYMQKSQWTLWRASSTVFSTIYLASLFPSRVRMGGSLRAKVVDTEPALTGTLLNLNVCVRSAKEQTLPALLFRLTFRGHHPPRSKRVEECASSCCIITRRAFFDLFFSFYLYKRKRGGRRGERGRWLHHDPMTYNFSR